MLTAKLTTFVEEYLVDFNGTQAAIRAGYSKRSASSIASENLRKPEVQAALRVRLAERARTNDISAQRVLQELAEIAFSDLGQLLEFSDKGIQFRAAADIPPAARRAVASVKIRRDLGGEDRPPTETVEFKLWDKVAALRSLAEHLGLLNEVEALMNRIRALEAMPDGEQQGRGDAARGSPKVGGR